MSRDSTAVPPTRHTTTTHTTTPHHAQTLRQYTIYTKPGGIKSSHTQHIQLHVYISTLPPCLYEVLRLFQNLKNFLSSLECDSWSIQFKHHPSGRPPAAGRRMEWGAGRRSRKPLVAPPHLLTSPHHLLLRTSSSSPEPPPALFLACEPLGSQPWNTALEARLPPPSQAFWDSTGQPTSSYK